VSEDCARYPGRRPELGCPLPTHEVEARNPKNLLQSLSWRNLKNKMKTRRLARLALKRTLGWDARCQSFEMSLMTRRQIPAASVVCDCIGDALYIMARISKSKAADKNHISLRQSCIPEVRERPEFRAKTLFSLSQVMITRCAPEL